MFLQELIKFCICIFLYLHWDLYAYIYLDIYMHAEPVCWEIPSPKNLSSDNRLCYRHTEKYFRNLIKSNPNQIVFTMQRLIWIQTDDRLVPNQSVHGKYNLISVWFNKISKSFLCYRTFWHILHILLRNIGNIVLLASTHINKHNSTHK